MASRETYTFALIKSLYDNKQDLLTTLRPFLLGVLETNAAVSATEAKAALIAKQAMDIPVHVIQKCADAAEGVGLLSVHRSSGGDREYVLTSAGQLEALDAQELADVKRRVRHATGFLVECMKERGMSIEPVEVDTTLRRLITRNLETVVGFVAAGGENDTLDVKTESAIESVLAECVTVAAQTQPDVYRTLRDLVYGSVVLATLSQGDDQLIETIKSRIDGLVAFVDTNWVLGVLELDTPARNLAATELTRLARQSGIQMRMLDFVLKETRGLLKFYEDEYDSGRLPIDPGSVFMQMKLRGKKPSDVLLLRSYLVDTLADHGITIEETGVDPMKHKPENPAWIDTLMYQKHADNSRTALVDLAAIAYVCGRRGKSASALESSKFLILSCDGTLARFNSHQMGHVAAGTYPEVVLDKTLTTILWLKNPGLDVPLEAVVAAHSRGLLHRQAVWFQVVAELSKAANSGTATRQDISIFLASEGPDIIAETVSNVDQVTPEVIQTMLVQAKRDHEEELGAAMSAVKDESEHAIAAVQVAAKQSIYEIQLQSAATSESARNATEGLQKRVGDLEGKQERALSELVEQAKTRARVWAMVVPVVFALLTIVCALAYRSSIEEWIGPDDFRTVFLPLTICLVTIVGVGLAALSYRVTVRRGEKRARSLF